MSETCTWECICLYEMGVEVFPILILLCYSVSATVTTAPVSVSVFYCWDEEVIFLLYCDVSFNFIFKKMRSFLQLLLLYFILLVILLLLCTNTKLLCTNTNLLCTNETFFSCFFKISNQKNSVHPKVKIYWKALAW